MAALLVAGSASQAADVAPEVRSARPAWTAARAGVQPGDRLEGFRAPDLSPPEQGRVRGAFDWMVAETLWADRSRIELSGRRGDAKQTWALRAGQSGLDIQPGSLGPQETAALARVNDALEVRDATRTCSELAPLAQGWRAAGRTADQAWAEWRCALAQIEWNPASAAEAVVAIVDQPQLQSLDPAARWTLLLRLDQKAVAMSLWPLHAALLARLETALPPAHPQRGLAESARLVGLVQQSDCANAIDGLAALAARWRREAPGSLRLARTLVDEAFCRATLGELETAQALREESLALARAQDDAGAEVARALMNLAQGQRALGDMTAAQSNAQDAAAHFEALDPDGIQLTPALATLSSVLSARGDLAGASATLERAYAIDRRIRPAGLATALRALNLAALAVRRGAYTDADRWSQRALPVIEALPPDSMHRVSAYELLGANAVGAERLDEAERWFQSAADLLRRLRADHPRLASPLRNIAVVRRRMGDLPGSREMLDEALARVREDPGSVRMAGLVWSLLADNSERQGEFARALTEAAEAERIQAALMPDSVQYAQTLNAKGRAQRGLGQAQARDTLCAAADALDRARPQLANGPAEQSQVLANYQQIRIDCVDAQVEAGAPAAALDVLERGRAAALRRMLAQRDLDLAADLPDDLRQAWRALESAQQDWLARRSALTLAEALARDGEFAAEGERLERERAGLLARLRQRAPRIAAGLSPAPLAIEGLQQRLGEDTAIIVYALGESAGHAFVLRSTGPLRTHRLTLGNAAAREALANLLAGLAPPFAGREDLVHQLNWWQQQLIEPLAADLEGSRHWWIAADAELLQLPFAALRDADGRWLFQTHSVRLADHASVFLGRNPQPAARAPLLAVARSEGLPAVTEVLRAYVGATGLPALPSAEREIRAIGDLYPRRQLLRGAKATEQAARSGASEVRVLHFATHGLFEPRLPLESGLLLAPDPAQAGAAGDGLLQAWEIFDGWHLKADVVALSACSSARGEALAGEGLIGLTRAFHQAGARDVVAAVYPVADAASARLMTAFHRALQSEPNPERALRQAQLELAGEPTRDGDGPLRGVGGVARADRTPHPRGIDPLVLTAFQVYGGD